MFGDEADRRVPPSDHAENVLRDRIREDRGHYFVEYQAADCRLPFASVSLVFPEQHERSQVAQAMERELISWLSRYPVPVMVSAFDATEDLIRLGVTSQESHLMGFVNPETGQIVQRWGLFKDEEMPSGQSETGYLSRVYKDIPARPQSDMRKKALREMRLQARALRVFLMLVVGVPVLLELVALGVVWLGHLLAAVSIAAGIWKFAKTMGWRKPTDSEKKESEKRSRMEHYYYHCERNPDAFARLRAETFRRDAIEGTRRQAEELRLRNRLSS